MSGCLSTHFENLLIDQVQFIKEMLREIRTLKKIFSMAFNFDSSSTRFQNAVGAFCRFSRVFFQVQDVYSKAKQKDIIKVHHFTPFNEFDDKTFRRCVFQP